MLELKLINKVTYSEQYFYYVTMICKKKKTNCRNRYSLKVHKIENFFDSDFGICVISLLVMSKY